MIDPRLQNHPVIRAEAERLAKEMLTEVHALGGHGFWGSSETTAHRAFVGASLRLLSDPSRPETRDYLVRTLEEMRCHDDWREFRDTAIIVDAWLEAHNA